jgi:hypothetical protein
MFDIPVVQAARPVHTMVAVAVVALLDLAEWVAQAALE